MNKYNNQFNPGGGIKLFIAAHLVGLSFAGGYAVYIAYDCTMELFKRQDKWYDLLPQEGKEQQRQAGNNKLEKIIELK